MDNRFVVPQFIDEEAKIIGPITMRQFIILLFALMILFILFKTVDFALFLLTGIPLLFFMIVLAFVKIRGQKFHFFLLNFVIKMRRPNVRIWDKSQQGNIEVMKVEEKKSEPPRLVKVAPSQGRLHELSLVVNTGGMYRPDEE
ncbi:MAG: PrgI family protein [Patescibacteria group bacterium]